MGSYDLGTSEPTALPFVETRKGQERTMNTACEANGDAAIRVEKQTFPHLPAVNGNKQAFPALEGLTRALLMELLLCN